VLYEIIRCFNNILQNVTSYKGIYRKKAVLNKSISANFVLFREINNSFRRASGTFVRFRFRHSFDESFNAKFRVISYFVNFGHFGHFRWRKVILPILQLPNHIQAKIHLLTRCPFSISYESVMFYDTGPRLQITR